MTAATRALSRSILCLITAPMIAAQTFEFYGNVATQLSFITKQEAIDGSLAQTDALNSRWALTLAELGVEKELWPGVIARAEVEQTRSDQNQFGLDQRFAPDNSPNLQWGDTALRRSDNPLRWSRAEIAYTFGPQSSLAIGLIRVPEISSERLYYKPYLGSFATDRTLGGILPNQGRLPGLGLSSSVGLLHYQLALWQQTGFKALSALPTTSIAPAAVDNDTADSLLNFTDSYETGVDGQGNQLATTSYLNSTDFDTKAWRPAIGGRTSAHQELPGYGCYAAGLGWALAPLNQPIIINTIAIFQSDSDSAQYSTVSFQRLAQWAIDSSLVLRNVQINLGYQYQKLLTESDVFFPALNGLSNQTQQAAQAFNKAGLSTSIWIESGCLFGQGQYAIDPAHGAISGIEVKSAQPVFELTARYGMAHHRNVSALIDESGFKDFDTDIAGTAEPSISIINGLYHSYSTGEKATLINVDNSGAYSRQISLQDDISYEHKTYGWQISLGVFFSQEMSLRFEYQVTHQSYRKHYSGEPRDLSWSNSLEARKIGLIKVGGQYAF